MSILTPDKIYINESIQMISSLFTLLTLASGCQSQNGPYSFPLQNPEDFDGTMGVDHDPTEYGEGVSAMNCLNYDGLSYPNCYDGHDGTDYTLKGAFAAMDAGSSAIIAAADGIVVEAVDGYYDRCHLDFSLSAYCDGYEMEANAVVIEHADGFRTSYLHMMNGSVAVYVGDHVKCGDFLGLVGSSGKSTAPHLHFEVETPEGETVDPYAGEFSQEESYWVHQGNSADYPKQKCRE